MKKTVVVALMMLLGVQGVVESRPRDIKRGHGRQRNNEAVVETKSVSGLDKSTFTPVEFEVLRFQRAGDKRRPRQKPKPHIPQPQPQPPAPQTQPPQVATSQNWSGYVGANNIQSPQVNSVTEVAGTWIVPQLSPTPDDTYVAYWVGIDGYSSGTVEQLGTEHDWSSGTQSNYAWFEMYPAGSYQISGFPVNVGDEITAEVQYVSTNTFQLSIYNITQNAVATIPTIYTRTSSAQRSSAEWIIEAPATSQGILPLANFGTGTFLDCVATINGSTSPIQNNNWQTLALDMVTQLGQIKAQTSSISGSNEGFAVLWEHE